MNKNNNLQENRVTKSLSYRQARVAVFIGFTLGIIFSAIQIAADMRREIDQTDQKFEQSLLAFEEPAFQAAFELDRTLAETVVNGLFQQDAIVEASVIDNYGDTMFHRKRDRTHDSISWLSKRVFGETQSYSTRLISPDTLFYAGDLSIKVDTNVIAKTFFQRSGLVLLFGILRNVFLAIILGLVFHRMLSRPLKELAQEIRSGSKELSVSADHKNDELGAIVEEYNKLFRGRDDAVGRLEREEKRFQHLFENSEFSLWNNDYSKVIETLNVLRRKGVSDLDGYLGDNPKTVVDWIRKVRILSVNAATLKLFGATSEAHLRENALNIFSDHTILMFRKFLIAIWEKHHNFRVETKMYTLDGKELSCVISLPIPDTFDGFRSIPVSILDITDFKMAEAERTFQIEIIEGIGEGVQASRMSDGVIMYTNAVLDELFGYERGELLGRYVGLLNADTEADHAATESEIRTALRVNGRWSGEVQNVRKDGSMFWSEASLMTYEHQIHGTLAIAVQSDITERRLTEEKLRQSQRLEAVGQLTGGVAHDFNNLLAVILGNQELLRDELTDPDQLSLIDASIGATSRGADLTRSMLAFARRSRLDPETTDLNTLVRETKNWLQRALPDNISFDITLAPEVWGVEVDRSAAESAILNLIVNARDAMQNGGRLSIETANVKIDDALQDDQGESLQAGHYVTVTVSDSGHGITEDILSNIFEPFFTTKAVGAGSGLGLSMIQGFMQQSRGAVRVTSEVDVGTTFTLYFNAGAGQIIQPKSEAASGLIETTTGAKILVVEDQQDVLDIITKVLKRAGYDVTSANSGDEARALLDDTTDFALLLTDLVMPGEIQGAELARQVCELKPDLPVIFMSGYADSSDMPSEAATPCTLQSQHLTKPVRRNELLEVIETALQQSA